MRILIKYGIADFDLGNEVRRLLGGISFARRTLQEYYWNYVGGKRRIVLTLRGT